MYEARQFTEYQPDRLDANVTRMCPAHSSTNSCAVQTILTKTAAKEIPQTCKNLAASIHLATSCKVPESLAERYKLYGFEVRRLEFSAHACARGNGEIDNDDEGDDTTRIAMMSI